MIFRTKVTIIYVITKQPADVHMIRFKWKYYILSWVTILEIIFIFIMRIIS